MTAARRERPIPSAVSQLAAAAGRDQDAASALWKAVFGLDAWFSIPRGEGQTVQPLVLEVDGAATLLLWTSDDAAIEGGRALDVLGDAEDPTLLSMPSAGVVELAPGYAEAGIRRVLFDHGATPFLVEMNSLPRLRQESLDSGV
ncbi:MAG: hypothetical protein HY996_07500 [Micrococcales bacterium]|nr:hypothetical protein [Micrococcales bacterium]